MGAACCVSRPESDTQPLEETRPKYSWERENRTDRSQLIISGKEGVVTGRLPGKLNGKQFHIQECKKCRIFILDRTSAVTVHGCSDCEIILGPCAGSVFIRECTDCIILAAAQQFRARDCRKCSVYIFSMSQPVMESCHKMKFGCYQLYYPDLMDQFLSAEMSVFSNQWSLIHDFSSQAGETKWSLVQKTTPPISVPEDGEFAGVGVTFDPSRSVVPLTCGMPGKENEGEVCLVAIGGVEREEKAMEFVRKAQRQLTIVKTYSEHFKAGDVELYFAENKDLLTKLKQGPCIIFYLAGSNCLPVSHACLAGQPTLTNHVSASPEEALSEIAALDNFALAKFAM